MKSLIVTFSIALFCSSAFAAEPGTAGTAGVQVPGDKFVCPDCGRIAAIGRHGQVSLSAGCPYCGEEACAEDMAGADFCFGADAGFLGRYVSRGVTLSDDPVFQPDVWASYRGLTVSVWGNMDLTDYNGNGGEFNELDFTAEYSWSTGGLSLSAGGIYYVFPGTGSDDTAELYAGISYDTVLQPTVTVFYDFLEADGLYGTFGVSHRIGLPEFAGLESSLDISAQVGWGTRGFNEFNSGSYHTAFTDAVFTAELPVNVYENLTLKPSVSYSTALDGTIRTKNEHNDNVVLGVTLSVCM